MKKLQCPLCGGNITIEKRVLYSDRPLLFHAGCEQCRWETNRGYAAEKDAWKDAEKFVSKFPPIMRLGQGDNVMVRFSDDTHTVLYTNVDRGKIYLQDVYGNVLPYDVDEIKQWPWELEQKGGSNDI